jgi:hypothetical protein
MLGASLQKMVSDSKNQKQYPASLRNLTFGIVITVDDEHWIRQKRYLRQFSAGPWSKTMVMTITKIPTKVFSHSSNTNI